MQNNIEQFRKNFYDNYHNHLIGELQKFEGKRVSKLIQAVVLSILLIICGILEIIFEGKFLGKIDCRIGLSLIIIGALTYSTMKKTFEKALKTEIMPSICKCFGDFTWRPNYEWHKTFVDAGVINNYTKVDVDDVFIGSYKSVGIKIIEAMYETGSGRYRQTVFDGVIIKLDMNKNFAGHTLLTEDKFFHNSPLRHLKHTELEDIDFEKKYDVFTDDPIEARYILTPTLMEKIKKIKFSFYCKELKCAFYQNNLIISIATGDKDLFSLGSLVQPVAGPEQFIELMEQFTSILELIDILELDKKAIL